ncbi:DUF3820 family protein [Salegentibacter mishustinae]|uniref:Cytoplasmic protein n=1 Tax=Salegentibacter mishustinae TaxID=270918 RepID=A0A0Q9ZLQ0_9FLAO|nr:DUF3820 family protein [Salegentibacter mishustinae]KRG30084.1 hypothetical protein APR42_12900 [Salegentibacter mishustinae]PNW19534.1 hypothetical protein APB85_16700 [Salegentibacter mishustinae]PZX62011.1 hypothetical protein LY54_02732 [Salegentibacter mishustinae]GGW95179.1 hypothetical protein GCM10008086_25230 [Salegentibacter mishustinae]
MNIQPNHKALLELAHAKMHFGKYKGYFLSDIPEYYLVWYRQKGFPEGKLGQQMSEVFELKLNGMEQLLRDIRRKFPKP